MKDNNRVALFIDAENISPKHANKILEEVSNYGDVIVKRIFADWSNPSVSPWKEIISNHSLLAEQQFLAVKGKNSSDISLIISALIVLFEKDIDVFCLASSDSDFTRLVQELREREKTVIGLGSSKTVKAFVNAFSEFIYLDEVQLEEKTNDIVEKSSNNIKNKNNVPKKPKIPKDRIIALNEIIDKLIDDNGKAYFANISNEMKNKSADFIPKNYGCKSLKEFLTRAIKFMPEYSIEVGKDKLSMFIIKK